MDSEVVLFWVVCFACLSGLGLAVVRIRSAGVGWGVLYLLILMVCLSGRFWDKKGLIYIASAMFLVFVVLPGFLGKLYHRRFLQQRYPDARRLARLISWLHPADGWPQQPGIVHAVELAQFGDLTAATETLKRYRGGKSLASLSAIPILCRITNQWEELIAWERRNPQTIERLPQLLHNFLRARGEVGDLSGLVELYDRHKSQIAKLALPAARDLCRLMLFVFSGKCSLVERLFDGNLGDLPVSTQKFWLATADLAAGRREEAKRQLELLLPESDALTRLAIERRLASISIPQVPLNPSEERIIESAALEQSHEEYFTAAPGLFSPQARATQMLIVLNVLMFAAEILLGGATNGAVLYHLGALFPAAVRAGEWWRLAASLFLHFGMLHLAMNMLALGFLGPFMEFALGPRKFLLVYLLAGIGSMGVVMVFASGPTGQQMTVGASGCVMGLVGATGALMLRGWRAEKALAAKRRLIAMFAIVAMQTVFDGLVPNVSMAAHLSGVAFGFSAIMILGDRLKVPRTDQVVVLNSQTKTNP